jgi:uncharacterized protein YndB with AHSA1/START domain
MTRPEIVYITYIASTAETVWTALTNGESTKQYFFGRRIESDWKVGSKMTLWMPDGRVDTQGKVLKAERPRLLQYTWHVEWMEELRNLPSTLVTFRIDPLGEVVRLTLTHESFEEDPEVDETLWENGRNGWAAILSGLKTLLETGRPLPPFDLSK